MWAGRAAALSARLARPAFAALPVLSVRCAASKAAAVVPGRDRVSKDVAEYWEQVLKTVDKATASKLIAHLDVTQVLGLPPPAEADAASASDGEGPAAAAAARRRGPATRKGRPPLYSYYVKVKKQHPKAVALVRVGEFYEAVGIDAVLLVQHAGLNPMGSGVPPRAGCPKQNLRRTVEDLVNAGLSVAVCEEAPENYSYGLAHKKQKDRYVAQVVTPASPHLLHGLVDEETDLLFDAAPPLLALVPQVGGYTVLEVSVDLGTVTVMEGLTEDAVYARLHEGGLAPPLFLHVPPAASGSGDRRLSESTFEREWEQRVAAVFRSQVGVVERYSDPDWLEGLLTRVRSMLGLDASTHFNVIRASTRDRPRPLYYCTALNLGLHKARGQPCLLDYLLPQGSQLPLRRWMRRLLLLPPGPATAVALHRVCEILAGLSESLPVFPHVPAASVVLKLRNREANDIFFREMGELCAAIQDLLTRTSPQLPQLADSLLEVACQETGVKLGRERVLTGCRTALAAIHEVVDHDTQLVAGEWLPALEGLGEDEREAMHKLMQANEGAFRGKVRESVMQQHCDAVLQAREWVQRELQAVFQPLLRAHEEAKAAGREKVKDRPYIIYDAVNNALWLRWPKDSAAGAEGKVMDLPHPRDRNGKVESSCYSSHGLESALDDYRRACDEAGKAVRAQLRKLAGDLQGVQTELVCAATMGVAAAALDAHTREALRRGWNLPVQGFTADGPPRPAPGGEPEPFEIADMWPYWLDGWDPSTVHNSLSLDGMALLTGPNMAGKSTILRSVCAVALLGACGLYAPAGSATVPYFDAFMLRNFSSDSPLEGRSAFAVEMTEMRYVLEDVSQRSLVLVDELGKGTEVRAGASLAGALMEELDRSGCRGIFATHLHALLDLELELSNTDFYMMETAAAEDEQEAAAALGELDALPPHSSSQTSGGLSSLGGTSGDSSSSDGRGMLGAANGVSRSGAASAAAAAVGQPRPRRPTWRIVQGVSTESMALDVARRCRLPPAVLARAGQLYARLEPMAARQLEPSSAAHPAAANGAAVVTAEAGQQEQQQEQQPLGSAAEGAAPVQVAARRGRAARTAASSSASAEAASEASQWTLEAAAAALQEVARGALAQGPSEEVSAAAQQQLQEVRFVRRGQQPGPATVGCSCVYVLRRPDGYFYAGSTEAIGDRLKSHRQRTGKGGPLMEMAFLSLGSSQGAASLARSVESAAIRELQRRGFPMLSAADARRRHVARASGVAAPDDK